MRYDTHGRRYAVAVGAVLTLLVTFAFTACVSVLGSTDPSSPEEAQSSGEVPEPAREYLIDTPEHTVMDTPWFTVSSVILQIQRTQPDTVIVLPSDPRARRYLDMGLVKETPTTVIPGNRFLFSLGVMTDGVPPFTANPDRYRNPDLYE